MTSGNTVIYGWKDGKPGCASGYVAPKVVEILHTLPGHRVLDLGSGNGALCAILAREGFEMVGVEQDQGGYEISRTYHSDIPFYNFDVQADPECVLSREAPFDLVVSTEVIEHLYAPDLLARFAAGALKKEGYFIVSTPYHGYLKNLLLSIFNKWDFHFNSHRCGGHIKFFSKKTLAKLLSDNGFSVIDFAGVGRFPYLWKSMIMVARKIRSDAESS